MYIYIYIYIYMSMEEESGVSKSRNTHGDQIPTNQDEHNILRLYYAS